jgi:CPA2 family monovalent cation:H+ antiporter-2
VIELLLLIAIATLGVAAADRLRLPSIVGFLVIGALVGPHGVGIVDDPERVSALAELGVVILLFEIGLELPVDRIRSFFREAVVTGGLQVGLTLGFGVGTALAFGVDLKGALVMGALVSMSSTALVMGILSDRGEIDAPHGRIATGVLLFQDLCIVPFLLAVPLLAAADDAGFGPVMRAIGSALLALALLFAGARLGLPALLDRAARAGSRELFALLSLLVVLGAAVAAEELGLTLAVGAFIAGLALSASPYSHQLFAELMPLRGILLGIFFTAVGMLVDVGAAVRAPTGPLLYALGVVGLKALLVAFVVAVVLRQGMRRALLAGLALAQTGEFSFVLAGTAAAAGLLAPELEQTFLAGSVLTLLATPFLIQAAPGLATRLGRLSGERLGDVEVGELPELRDHVVVVGFGLAGRNIARVLRARGVPYVGVEANAQTVRSARARDEPIHYGDATRRALVSRLGVKHARLVVVAISDPPATREIVTLLRSLAPGVPVIARTRYVEEIDALESAGATVVTEEYEVTLELVAETLRRFDVPDELIVRFTAGLREEGYELMRAPAAMILDPWLSEVLEEDGSAWVEVPEGFVAGPSLAELNLRARTGVNVVAVERGGDKLLNPPPSYTLRNGDRLLVLGSPDALGRLRQALEPAAPG